MTREISDLIWEYLEVEHGFSRYKNCFEIRRVLFSDAYEVNVFRNGSRQIVKNFTFTDEQLENIGKTDFKAKVTKPYPFIQKEYTYGKARQEKETTMNRLEAEAVLNNVAKELAKIELLEQKYGVDADYKNGDVLLVEIMYNNAKHTYTYAIVKANYFWYSTAIAASAFKRGSFEDLIYWMENVNGTVVSMRKLGKGKAIIRNGVRV